MISLAELSKRNPLFNDDLYISVSELIEVITNHSDGNEDDVITYLVQGLDVNSILVHQKTITVGYYDINHDFIIFLTDDELEPLKFTELSNKFDLSSHYLPKNELAKIRNIEQLNIELLSNFNCDDLPNSINLEGDNDSEILNEKLSGAEDTILKLKAEIATLEDEYRKLESENKSFRLDLNKYSSDKTNKQLHPIEKKNLINSLFKGVGIAIADYIWKMDDKEKVMKKRMVQEVQSILYNIQSPMLPEEFEVSKNSTIDEWLKDIVPSYANPNGRPKNKDQEEQPILYMKK